MGKLTHTAEAYLTLPARLGAPYLTDADVAEEFVALWRDAAKFLNELAPHGYRVIHVDMTPQSETKAYRLTIGLMVCESDFKRIRAEWQINGRNKRS